MSSPRSSELLASGLFEALLRPTASNVFESTVEQLAAVVPRPLLLALFCGA